MVLTFAECLDAVTRVESPHGEGCQCHLIKADGGGETVPQGDTFIREELVLAALMLAAWNKAVTETGIDELIIESARKGGVDQFVAVLDKAAYDVDDVFESYMDTKEVRDTVDKTLLIGVLLWGSQTVYDAMSRSRLMVVDGVMEQIRYYANSYFERIIYGTVLDAARRATGEIIDVVTPVIGQRVTQTAPYWRTVANVETSRAHHYGVARGALGRGMRGYRFVAVMDNRTTPVCISLNGREFWLASAVNVLESMATMSGADVATAYPWPRSAADLNGLSNDELMVRGWAVPPLHYRCRSTIRPIS